MSRADFRDHKISFCQSPGLVKYHCAHICQSLHIVGAFDQDPLAAGSSDPSEKCQGNTDNNGTGAAYDQECKSAVDPVGPQAPFTCLVENKNVGGRAKSGQSQRAIADRRCVPAGESGNELLRLCLIGTGVFDQIQDPGGRGFLELPGRPHPQDSGKVDRAAQDLPALRDIAGNRFPGQG